MKSTIGLALAVFGLLVGAAPASAHHAFAAEYDAKNPVNVTGTVTKVDWRNPHGWFYMDVKDASGKVTNWGFEMPSPNELIRSGWTRNTIKEGDIITVDGLRSKDGSTSGNAKFITFTATGKKISTNAELPSQ
jgi:hypothetical protein